VLRDLTRADWLRILALPEARIPRALLLRGTRSLRRQYERYRQYCTDVIDLGDENTVLDDLFVGNLEGVPVGYASVYGANMASEVTHVFGMLGTPLVIQCGNCGALAEQIDTGDLFVATEAFCGEGAAQYYVDDATLVKASYGAAGREALQSVGSSLVHWGSIYTTAALFAEGDRELEEWARRGFAAVDMETATTFAVAEHFGMERLSILYAWDNPRKQQHIFLNDDEKSKRREAGDQEATALVRRVVAAYGQAVAG